jgi:hypothetical protein
MAVWWHVRHVKRRPQRAWGEREWSMSGDLIMSDWQTSASPDQLSDTPPEGIPVITDELWGPVHAPADRYWEYLSAPAGERPRMSEWARMPATARSYVRLLLIIAMYLGTVAAVSLIVTRAGSAPAKHVSAAGTAQQQEQNAVVSRPSAQDKRSAPGKPPARQLVSPVFPSPGLSLFWPPPVSTQPLPGGSASTPASPSSSPAPTPAPSPTSVPPSSPPPSSPPPSSPPPSSPPPSSPPPSSPPPSSPPPTGPTGGPTPTST